MRCIRPTQFKKNGSFHRCGQCMPCRITKRTEWTTRLVLEHRYHNNLGSFITLTYNPENLPESEKYRGGNLIKSDVQKFIKRFRKRLGNGKRISYFAVGEYGGQTGRAHYHICIFGLESHLVKKYTELSWTQGYSMVSDLQKDGFNRMRYTVGYTLKKLTTPSAIKRETGDDRNPEFSLMSRKPALGASILPVFINTMKKRNWYPAKGLDQANTYYMEKQMQHMIPWPGIFKIQNHTMLMDKYLQDLLFKMTYPEIIESYEKFNKQKQLETSAILDNYIDNKSYFSQRDNLRFMTGEEYEQEKKKSDKEKRKLKRQQETAKL